MAVALFVSTSLGIDGRFRQCCHMQCVINVHLPCSVVFILYGTFGGAVAYRN